MNISILDYLEASAVQYANKVAYEDVNVKLTFAQVRNYARAIGSKCIEITRGQKNFPVMVLLEQSAYSVVAFMGACYGGGFYVPTDITSPTERLLKIVNMLGEGAVIVTNTQHLDKATELGVDCGHIILMEDAIKGLPDDQKIEQIRLQIIDTDPLYILFTSGSTGIPKGVTICHRSAIDYTEWFTDTYHISENTRFGNQVPFYFDLSIQDVFAPLKTGATTSIIPKSCFMFPLKLISFLNDYQINTIIWVPSALIFVANTKALDKLLPQYLQMVIFAGEVMPNKQLNIWRKALPNLLYSNMFGPTEITNICTYYIVDREMTDDEPLPIGKPCKNVDIIVLDAKNDLVTDANTTGELCVRGTSLAHGYYCNFDKTNLVFVQNPLNKCYPEKIYRTGDLVQYNEDRDLIYMGRIDFQIKHMGHRIEIGEIETAASAISAIEQSCVIFNSVKDQLLLIFQGSNLSKEMILDELKAKLPAYMIPNRMIEVENMPLNPNGKIDRNLLMQRYADETN